MLSIIKPFICWAAYPALLKFSSNNHLQAALTCLILIFLISYRNLRRGFIIDWTAVIFFVSIIVLSVLFGPFKFFDHSLLLISGVYTIVAAGSLLIGYPYTLQYAREVTSEDYWNDEIFFVINRHITLIWTMIFFVSFVCSAVAIILPDYWPIFIITRNILIAAGLVLPDHYPDLYLRKIGELDA